MNSRSLSARIFLGICAFIAVNTTINAFVPLPLFKLLESKKAEAPSKNLILILDVKQQERGMGACGLILATALLDKQFPVIASYHALAFIESYFNPKDWDIYQNNNLVLFMPKVKAYVGNQHKYFAESDGFNLGGWSKKTFGSGAMRVSQLHSLLKTTCRVSADQPLDQKLYDDLSKQSVDIIDNTLAKNKTNKWKVYVVGHGAPDASQVCGLNLADFQQFLNILDSNLSVDFLVYQTCFGGSKNQLKEVYKATNDAFKQFNFPIISCSLTNSVSFATFPDQGVSFKRMFAKVSHESIVEQKMRRLLKAVNELTKCLDYASEYHWSNNLLLVRMPNAQYFEPVVDNKYVFKCSDLQSEGLNDNSVFKCVLVDKPILNKAIALDKASNFMIASGISRSKHWIKDLRMPEPKSDYPRSGVSIEQALKQLACHFSSLAFPEKEKQFYIEHLSLGTKYTFEKVCIALEPVGYYARYSLVRIDALYNSVLYHGYIEIDLEYPTWVEYDIATAAENDAKNYLQKYHAVVQKHLNKEHKLPFNFMPVFSI